ncbi:PIG-L family deacetylase [Pyruvatibacter sp.]|uniref:PIG-L deacetylase family protein n=1 Tax=Pyruvatibacter sp. TaxID=1981328 RepID=UPI0032EDEB30
MLKTLGRIGAMLGAVLGAAALLAAMVGVVWLDALFEEPGVAHVLSLAGELGAKRVMVVVAHPDDEQLVAGLIVKAIEGGADVSMITATRGEAGSQRPQVARQAELGIIRTAEVLKNGYALGVTAQEVWNMPDGGLETRVPFMALVADIVRAFHRHEPDLVVTFWPESGATGHTDHMRIGLAVQHAVKQFEGIHVYRGPKHIAYTLMPRGIMQRLGGERGRFVADNQPAPTHSMPGDARIKQRGWDIHASQRDYVQCVYAVPANVLYAFFDKEFYFVEAVE